MLNFMYFAVLMKSDFNKIASFIMALVVLFSTFSFTVEQHYCCDNLCKSSTKSGLILV